MDFGGGWKDGNDKLDSNGVNRHKENERTSNRDTDSKLYCQISIHKRKLATYASVMHVSSLPYGNPVDNVDAKKEHNLPASSKSAEKSG